MATESDLIDLLEAIGDRAPAPKTTLDRLTLQAGPGPTVDHATYPLPLDGYYASATQERTLGRAQFALARRCAQTHGVSVPNAHVPVANPAAAFMNDPANNVSPLTLRQARTIGYDSYPSRTSPIDAATAGLTSRQLEILEGWNGRTRPNPPITRFLFDGGCPLK